MNLLCIVSPKETKMSSTGVAITGIFAASFANEYRLFTFIKLAAKMPVTAMTVEHALVSLGNTTPIEFVQ
jgi:hypothetical protein